MDKKLETKIIKEINDILNLFGDKYIIQNVVNKAKVIQDLDDYNEQLVGAILSNKVLSNQFVIEVNGVSILKVNQLIEVFQLSDYWMDSYTKYSKKIGLTSKGKFLDEITDVVLDFPYKDTILKANMSKEEKEHEDLLPNEPFLNEVVAKEEIDVLFDSKILINAKKYDVNGENAITKFTDEDNLILKGNNLLALHTLKERYTGKIKFIYIDPPYNTGSDSFQYNDRFNHSTWLIFMRNRIEIAKELLSEDGIIAIQTDYHENSYIRVLLDELFGRNNYVSEIAIQMSTASGPKMANIKSTIPKLKDSIVIFSKGSFEINEQPYKQKSKWDKEYSKILMNFTKDDRLSLNQFMMEKNYEKIKDIIEKVKLSTISREFPEHKNDNNWLMENSWRIVADKQNSGLDKLLSISDKFWNGDVSVARTKRGNLSFFRTDKQFGDDTRLEIVFADNNLKEHTGDLWTDISTSGGFSDEGGVKFPTAKKPEKLLRRLIGMFTFEKDIVLDFFMGSSTTQATALKMNRQFIGIEQMDYIKSVSVPRLNNVIKGEQTGISKDVKWQGGGSFVYAELMEKNRGFLKTILNAKDIMTLKETFNLMLDTGDFDFRVDLTEVSQTIWNFPIEEQKKILVKIIDKNQLYFNYSEIDDENVREFISDSDYIFNKNFYKK